MVKNLNQLKNTYKREVVDVIEKELTEDVVSITYSFSRELYDIRRDEVKSK